MTAAQRLQSAAQSPHAVPALRSVVEELSTEQHSREDIYQMLQELALRLRGQGGSRGAEEEAVFEVMDALTGWCHPDARLLPED